MALLVNFGNLSTGPTEHLLQASAQDTCQEQEKSESRLAYLTEGDSALRGRGECSSSQERVRKKKNLFNLLNVLSQVKKEIGKLEKTVIRG